MVTKLVEVDKVLFVFQTLGTPSNTAIQKYLNEARRCRSCSWPPAPPSGATQGQPVDDGLAARLRHRKSIIYAKHILANVKDPKIAVLMQNDDYGKDYFNGFKQGLGKDANKIVQVATYEVADPTVDSQMIALKNSGANVFFNITIPKFAAQAIKKAAEIGWKPAHYLNNVSASVGTVMKPAGFENAQGILTADYLKDPTDPQCAKDKDLQDWNGLHEEVLSRRQPRCRRENAYGYAVANLLVQVLKQAGDDLTRANIMKQAANLKGIELPMILPGIKVNTSPTDFYPIQSVKLQRFKGETWELFGDILSAKPSSASQ